MVTVVGVRFREVGKIYYFAPGELTLKRGDHVIVDTVRGQEYGTVMLGNRQVEDEEIVQPLKPVDRVATKDDEEREAANRDKEKDAFDICKSRIREHGLEMKLISAEYSFDNSKILFCFTADGRVDFRDLVKDLASIFKIRIELRQVGVRDETKIMGGIGYCGRPLCCCSYLSDFVPVSIRMAKEQNLSLNPQKISGMCGRLMCCLKNEVEAYEDLNTRLPKQGAKVRTSDGREGIAQNVNVLRESIQVLFTDEKGNREMEEFPASELKFTPRRKKPACSGCENCQAAQTPQDAEAANAGGEANEDVTRELAEEAAQETDPELRELEAEELSDMKAESEAEPGDKAEGSARRPRRKRRYHDGADRHGSDISQQSGEDDSREGADGRRGSDRRECGDGQSRGDRRERSNGRSGNDRRERTDGQGRSDRRERADGSNRDNNREHAGDRDRRNNRQRRDGQNGNDTGREGSEGDRHSNGENSGKYDDRRREHRNNNFRRRPRSGSGGQQREQGQQEQRKAQGQQGQGQQGQSGDGSAT